MDGEGWINRRGVWGRQMTDKGAVGTDGWTDKWDGWGLMYREKVGCAGIEKERDRFGP